MADTKVQTSEKTQPTSSNQGREQGQQQGSGERGLSHRQESSLWRDPWRDMFSFSPFSIMRRMSEEMDRAFSSSMGLNRWSGESGMWNPAVDIRERNGNIEITAELPGMNKEDVHVECTDEGLIIQGEKRRESQKEEGGVHRTERSYGRFYRMIPQPEGAQTDQAKAEFKNGVLDVRIPVPEQKQKGRQIPISS